LEYWADSLSSAGTLQAVKAGESASSEQSAVQKRKPGRPRPPSTDQNILRATLELLRLGGADGVTIDAIAARSGSAKTTIYRRWPSLESLVVDALRMAIRARMDQVTEIQEYDVVQGSTVRGAARQMLSLVNEPLFRSAFPMMARILLGDKTLGDRFRAEVFTPLRALRRTELLRIQELGGIRPTVDPDLILDMVNGAILYRALMAERLDGDVADEIVDLLVRAIEVEVVVTPTT
jgi:AcrR family transcriptional regulator